MKTLLHTCCAPCANQCIEVLQGDGLEVTALPNTVPAATACGITAKPSSCR